MLKYKPGDDVGELEDWPFDNPLSDYKIKDGEPKASGRLDAGGPGHTTRTGIWRCTKGLFECTEQGDELMTVLSGRCRLIDMASGQVINGPKVTEESQLHGSRLIYHVFRRNYRGTKEDTGHGGRCGRESNTFHIVTLLAHPTALPRLSFTVHRGVNFEDACREGLSSFIG
jgi:hypothetical protein